MMLDTIMIIIMIIIILHHPGLDSVPTHTHTYVRTYLAASSLDKPLLLPGSFKSMTAMTLAPSSSRDHSWSLYSTLGLRVSDQMKRGQIITYDRLIIMKMMSLRADRYKRL